MFRVGEKPTENETILIQNQKLREKPSLINCKTIFITF